MKKLLSIICAIAILNIAMFTHTMKKPSITIDINNQSLMGFKYNHVSATYETPNMVISITKQLGEGPEKGKFYLRIRTPKEVIEDVASTFIGVKDLHKKLKKEFGDEINPKTNKPIFKKLIDLINYYHKKYNNDLLTKKDFSKNITVTPLMEAKIRAELRAPEGEIEEEERGHSVFPYSSKKSH